MSNPSEVSMRLAQVAADTVPHTPASAVPHIARALAEAGVDEAVVCISEALEDALIPDHTRRILCSAVDALDGGKR